MADDEAKILKRKEPPRHSGVSVLGPSHPLEGRVVRQERKLTAENIYIYIYTTLQRKCQ